MSRYLVVCVFLAVGMTLCAPLLVRADEQPCKAVGATVVCQRDGFDVLVRKLLDAKSDATKCALAAESSTADAEVLKARLAFANAERDKAVADVTVLRARPSRVGRRFVAVGLGVLSGLALAASPQVHSESVSAALLVTSAASIATAGVLVVLE